jgi:hypothetical protein
MQSRSLFFLDYGTYLSASAEILDYRYKQDRLVLPGQGLL